MQPKMSLAESQALCLQARFIPEGVAQGTDEPQGNEQVASLGGQETSDKVVKS